MIYFCQGCSAVFDQRKKYCPHCGKKQYYDYTCDNCGEEIEDDSIEECPECYSTIERDEDKIRYCPHCGYNLDTDGRNLDLKYCFDADCCKEIGGLIRYSEETGEELTVDEIMQKNDYNKELKYWLKALYLKHDTFCRYLYIYDKSGNYSSNKFVFDYSQLLKDFEIYNFNFSEFLNDDILDKLVDPDGKFNKLPKICIVDISEYNEFTENHYILFHFFDYWYYNSEYNYSDFVKTTNATFVFVSGVLPSASNIGSHLDKRYLIITPEILKSVNIVPIISEVKSLPN